MEKEIDRTRHIFHPLFLIGLSIVISVPLQPFFPAFHCLNDISYFSFPSPCRAVPFQDHSEIGLRLPQFCRESSTNQI